MPANRLQTVRKWWGKQVNECPAWRTDELPASQFKDILLTLNLGYEVRRDTLVLGKPGAALPDLIRSYFREIVSCILKPYAPYAITGIAAMYYYLGEESIPNELDIITKGSSTRIDLHQISLLVLEKNPEFFQNSYCAKRLKSIKIRNTYNLTIESPESLLVRLRPQHLRDYPQVISSFLKAIDFDTEILAELLLQESRPIVYQRLAALLEQSGKLVEAKIVRHSVKATTSYALPGKAQLIKYSLPDSLILPQQVSDPIYITRFRHQFRIYRDCVEHQLKTAKLPHAKLPHWSLRQINTYADRLKKYDTYHSSTIEGYRVTPDEIQALIEAKSNSITGASREEIERRMALEGYLEAHTFVLQIISEHFKKTHPLTELTIRELYAHLFSPSVRAGLLEKKQLTQYRNHPVYIRNSRHVPPNHEKVADLMRCMVEELNEIENQVTRALLAHYAFVTIHPYPDGNGRVARFLMNYILSLGRIPWITIRVEDRDKYFHALERAQCDEDISGFVKFFKRYLEEIPLDI